MGQGVSLALAILKAIPAIRDFFEAVALAYYESKLAEMKRENKEAVDKVKYENDQRDIEKILGTERAGKPSGLPGTVIVDASGLPDIVPDAKP